MKRFTYISIQILITLLELIFMITVVGFILYHIYSFYAERFLVYRQAFSKKPIFLNSAISLDEKIQLWNYLHTIQTNNEFN